MIQASREGSAFQRLIASPLFVLDDGDGDMDIATAGKTGVFFFENLTVNHVPKTTREQQILLNKDWPFPGEGAIVQQENGPSKP